MKPHAPLPAPVTDTQRAIAWRSMRRPHTWPATLEEALTDPLRMKLIDGYAQRINRPPFQPINAGAMHRLPSAPVPPTPSAPPARTPVRMGRPPNARLPQLGDFDPRRAAANDFDET